MEELYTKYIDHYTILRDSAEYTILYNGEQLYTPHYTKWWKDTKAHTRVDLMCIAEMLLTNKRACIKCDDLIEFVRAKAPHLFGLDRLLWLMVYVPKEQQLQLLYNIGFVEYKREYPNTYTTFGDSSRICPGEQATKMLVDSTTEYILDEKVLLVPQNIQVTSAEWIEFIYKATQRWW